MIFSPHFFKGKLNILVLILFLCGNLTACDDQSDGDSAWDSARKEIRGTEGQSQQEDESGSAWKDVKLYYSSQSSDGSPNPTIDYSLIASIDPTDQFRNNYINLSFNLTNNEIKYELYSFKIKGYLLPTYKIINMSDLNINNMSFSNIDNDPKQGASFNINCRNLGPGQSRIFNYTIHILNNTEIGSHEIFECLVTNSQPRGKFIEELDPTVSIINNNPNIIFLNLSMDQDRVIHIDNNTLMLINPEGENYIAINIKAIDIEDKSFNYSLMILESTEKENDIRSFSFNVSEVLLPIASLEKGKYYKFRLRVNDSDKGYSEENGSIYVNNHNYKILLIPNVSQYENVSILISIAVTIAIAFLLFILHPKNVNLLVKINKYIYLIIILILVCLF
jgi:hypothetical protein